MGDIIKDRRNPTLEGSVKELSTQVLEKLIEFDLNKIEDNYNEHLDANLKIMMKEYGERYNNPKFTKNSDTIMRFKEYEERFRKFSKPGIIYSQ